MRTSYRQIPAYTTRDGSQIRELMHPAHHPVRNQSLAEASLAPGQKTLLHRHHRSEEIYHVVAGSGLMTLGGAVFALRRGDSVVIAPGTPHCVENTGRAPLRILCACAPSYAHDDTEVLAPADACREAHPL